MRTVNIKWNIFVYSLLILSISTSFYLSVMYSERNIDFIKMGKTINDLTNKNDELKKELTRLDPEIVKEQDFKLTIYKGLSSRFYRIVTSVYDVSKKYDINPYIIVGIMQTESAFNQYAQSFWRDGRPLAYGLMQIHLAVWRDPLLIDEDKIFDIEYNIELGAKIFRYYLDRAKGDVHKALHFYNNGENPNKFNNTEYKNNVIKKIGKYTEEEKLDEILQTINSEL